MVLFDPDCSISNLENILFYNPMVIIHKINKVVCSYWEDNSDSLGTKTVGLIVNQYNKIIVTSAHYTWSFYK